MDQLRFLHNDDLAILLLFRRELPSFAFDELFISQPPTDL